MTVKSKGLAHNSYMLLDGNEASVVDPRRDCKIYAELARRECARILYVLETHRNEDYVTGSVELRSMVGAEIARGQQLPFKYGEHSLADGDTLTVGSLKIEALHTPGHTDESMCYVVYREGKTATMVFTGDTLFAGAVGRTDLYGEEAQPRQAAKLYESLHERLLPLGDHVLVYPSHGTGSVCGTEIDDREVTTIGYERLANPMLKKNKQQFIEQSVRQKMLVPPYFKTMEQHNLDGPPLLKDATVPQPLGVSEFETQMQKLNTVVVDTREPGAFAASHVPGSISIWLDGLSVFAGWTLEYGQNLLLVTEREADLRLAEVRLHRTGFDNVVGTLCGGIRGWRESGKPIAHVGALSAVALKSGMEGDKFLLLDVRSPSEWAEGHAAGVRAIYVGHLATGAASLPRDKPIAVTCSVGYRGSLGASILKRLGFEDVYNVLGGMEAWQSLGYPLEMERAR